MEKQGKAPGQNSALEIRKSQFARLFEEISLLFLFPQKSFSEYNYPIAQQQQEVTVFRAAVENEHLSLFPASYIAFSTLTKDHLRKNLLSGFLKSPTAVIVVAQTNFWPRELPERAKTHLFPTSSFFSYFFSFASLPPRLSWKKNQMDHFPFFAAYVCAEMLVATSIFQKGARGGKS